MKSIVTAALVLVVEAGFVLSIAMTPSPAELASARPEVVARQAPSAPAVPVSRSEQRLRATPPPAAGLASARRRPGRFGALTARTAAAPAPPDRPA